MAGSTTSTEMSYGGWQSELAARKQRVGIQHEQVVDGVFCQLTRFARGHLQTYGVLEKQDPQRSVLPRFSTYARYPGVRAIESRVRPILSKARPHGRASAP